MPKIAGDYKVFVTFLGKDIPNSPFNVHVAENIGDVSRIQLLGPGLQADGNYCGKITYFEIIAEGYFHIFSVFFFVIDLRRFFLFFVK